MKIVQQASKFKYEMYRSVQAGRSHRRASGLNLAGAEQGLKEAKLYHHEDKLSRAPTKHFFSAKGQFKCGLELAMKILV